MESTDIKVGDIVTLRGNPSLRGNVVAVYGEWAWVAGLDGSEDDPSTWPLDPLNVVPPDEVRYLNLYENTARGWDCGFLHTSRSDADAQSQRGRGRIAVIIINFTKKTTEYVPMEDR